MSDAGGAAGRSRWDVALSKVVGMVVARLPVGKSRRLSWQRDLIRREFAKNMSAADAQMKEHLVGEHRWDLGLIEEEIDMHYARGLMQKANRLHVPLPESDMSGKYWIQGETTGEWYLSDEGCRRVRELIREESRGQWESVSRWVPLVGALAAIVAAAASMWTVFKHK